MNFPDIVEHPSAWKGSDFSGPGDVAFDLEERHLDALRACVARAGAAGRGLQALTGADTALPEIAADLAELRHELMEGRGLVILRGWPVEEMDQDALAIAYWAFSAHLGRGVSQSPMGDRLGHVTDVSRPGQRERGYRSAQELALHTDSDDIVGLLCIRQARTGGDSVLASSIAVHNEIARQRPDLLAPLFAGYRYHWFGEQPPGEGAVTSYRVPVFGHAGGKLSCVFLRAFIEMAAEETGVPLTDVEAEALQFFAATAERDDLALRFRLQPGWASFINNYTTLHARTAFEDWPQPERKRLLLRLWLKASPARPLVAGQRRYYGDDGMFVDGRSDTSYRPARRPAPPPSA